MLEKRSSPCNVATGAETHGIYATALSASDTWCASFVSRKSMGQIQMGTFSKFQDLTKIVATKRNQHNYKIIARKHPTLHLDQIVCCVEPWQTSSLDLKFPLFYSVSQQQLMTISASSCRIEKLGYFVRPRRPPTSYFLWLSENREEIAKSLGTGKGPSVSKKASFAKKYLTEAVFNVNFALTKQMSLKTAQIEKESYTQKHRALTRPVIHGHPGWWAMEATYRGWKETLRSSSQTVEVGIRRPLSTAEKNTSKIYLLESSWGWGFPHAQEKKMTLFKALYLFHKLVTWRWLPGWCGAFFGRLRVELSPRSALLEKIPRHLVDRKGDVFRLDDTVALPVVVCGLVWLWDNLCLTV